MPSVPENYHAASDARLGSMLQERLEAGYTFIELKPEHLPEVTDALTNWVVVKEPSATEMAASGLPALQAKEALAVALAVRDALDELPGVRMSDWASKQIKRGRAVFIRGNPLPPLREQLQAYATDYLDIAGAAERPGFMMARPSAWKTSEELVTASDVELAVRNYPVLVAVAGVGAVGVAAAILYYALTSAKSLT